MAIPVPKLRAKHEDFQERMVGLLLLSQCCLSCTIRACPARRPAGKEEAS